MVQEHRAGHHRWSARGICESDRPGCPRLRDPVVEKEGV